MFIDMVGSSEYKQKNPGKAGATHVLTHNRLAYFSASDYLERNGFENSHLEINKLIGDGLLLYFKTDSKNTIRQCEFALNTAKYIIKEFSDYNEGKSENEKLHTRIIIDWSKLVFRYDGPVQSYPEIISGEADFASYLLGWAKEDQILVTESFRDKLIHSKKQSAKLENPHSKDVFFFTGKIIYAVEGDDPSKFPRVKSPLPILSYWIDRNEIKTRHEEMRSSFIESNRENPERIEIEAVWFADWGPLKDYTSDEADLLKNTNNLIIRRLINTKTVSGDFVDSHLKKLNEFHLTNEEYENNTIMKGYQCRHADVSSFEVMITLVGPDHTPESALLTIHKPKDQTTVSVDNRVLPGMVIPRMAIYFDVKKHPGIVKALHEWFEKIWMSSDRDLFHELVWGNPEDYDILVNDPQNKFLRSFIQQEEEYLKKLVEKYENIALIEVGSGTGRVFKAVEHLSNRFSYLIGIDIARRMVEHATQKFKSNKIIFLHLDGIRLAEFFGAGTVSKNELMSEFSQNKTVEKIDPQKFRDSKKIICCLLNTQGTINEKCRKKVIKSMVESAGKNSIIILSFLNGEKFKDVSHKIYNDAFRKLAGDFDTTNFNYDTNTFKTKHGYESKWFTKDQVKEMLQELTNLDIPDPHLIKYDGVEIGFIYQLHT